MSWDEASDFEVNKRLAELLWLEVSPVSNESYGLAVYPYNNEPNANYCQNWQDIGPIIYQYGISLNFHGCDYWTASTVNNVVVVTDMSPQRAAAICAIKLLESEK